MQAVFLSVQNINRKVEISGKGYPQKIGNIDDGGGSRRTPEAHYHRKDERPQYDEPAEREIVEPKPEKEYTPKEIEKKLKSEKSHRPADDDITGFRGEHEIEWNPHKDI